MTHRSRSFLSRFMLLLCLLPVIFTSGVTLTQSPTGTPIPPLALVTNTPVASPGPSPTPPLQAPPLAVNPGNPPAEILSAGFSAASGWSCGDFPCADDIEGFGQRIRVAPGFALEFVGRFPGQVMQITYGRDGRLYATVLENGTRSGAVYVMNADGSTARYSGTLFSPLGLAFQPGSEVLYVTARTTPLQGGMLWRILPDGTQEAVISDLPCCLMEIDNQPNGLIFGPDGYLYMGIGSLTDHAESPDPTVRAYLDPLPLEAAVLRIHPHTGEIVPYASGIRNPYDLAMDSTGLLYATDSGLLSGPGDRILGLAPGGFYGWPYYRFRGCAECPPSRAGQEPLPELLALPDYSLPRGIVAYTGGQFPGNLFDTLFVALWNGSEQAQRILWIEPRRITAEYVPVTFMTGLIRPIDVAIAPDGALVVADFIYGHIWRVSYTGMGAVPPSPTATSVLDFLTPAAGMTIEAATAVPTLEPGVFTTNTPQG